ncbi:MAG: hypothetical protein JWN74_843 [Acidobacteriaceae bacterium]|nr:hypothetical protein [Acidobacteriaceae bacterium]
MQTQCKKMVLVLGIVLIASMITARANAACGDIKVGATFHRQSWQGSGALQSGSLVMVSDRDEDSSIVGMWHVTLTAQGNAEGPPDGTPLDNALVVWHSDKTEIMNSARPPQDGNFCMGVWEKTGKNRYKLNHFAWLANDTANAPSGVGNPTGPVQVVEDVVLSRDRNHYAGTFVTDAYDASNTRIAHVTGVIAATRITVNTPETSLF